MEQYIQQLIALLFTAGEGITHARLEHALNVKRATLDEVCTAASARLEQLGLQIHAADTKITIATHPNVSPVVSDFVGEELKSNLSKSALETMTIVLYKGPVSRSVIDYIRGVNSTYALQSLLARGLVERKVNPKDARSFIYTASEEFLRYLGVMRPSELPGFTALTYAKDDEIAAALVAAEATEHDETQS
ncbi:MAG: SMC-Scp complex subunit ScpB [Patescibacteria group bacterium]